MPGWFQNGTYTDLVMEMRLIPEQTNLRNPLEKNLPGGLLILRLGLALVFKRIHKSQEIAIPPSGY